MEAPLDAVLEMFVGARPQRPPKYSALKVNGRSHMSRARAGEEFEVAERPAHCFSITVLERQAAAVVLDVHVASGYYIRSLARDLGEALGVPAHLSGLVRTHVGPWSVADAVPIEALTQPAVRPLGEALPDIPVVTLGTEDALFVRQGKRIEAQRAEPCVMALDPEGTPLAMLDRTESAQWRVRRGFALVSQTVSVHRDSLIDKDANHS